MRVQGAFASSQEIQKVIDFINGKESYIEEVGVHININARDVISVSGTDSIKETYDAYLEDAGKFIIEKEKRLLEYKPKYTNLETIDLAIQSYIDRGLISVKR